MSRESPPNSEHDLELLAFSLHCHFRDLEDASLRRLLEEEPPVELVKRWLTCIEAHFPVDDHDRLVRSSSSALRDLTSLNIRSHRSS